MDKFKNVKKTLLTILMFIIGVLFMSPFLWMISASMKPEADVFLYPIQWIPKHWNLIENYKTVWSTKFSLYYWNSIKVSVLTTALSVLLSSMAAYAFSKIKFRGQPSTRSTYGAIQCNGCSRQFGAIDTNFQRECERYIQSSYPCC
ncbi:carbohydrate ABC transporter permease [Paenibacillus frigoriresistens]|uniref:carbohydrate ABC transporter permease n=1 Tax=Paenibacillus alginolyticus TaxID=59839 RepID=UPI001564ED91|nr:carbohydrate ABC transporter permease [Paenibacillus frigoriresistens]NRF93450.1 carbohydrate ABC transporter permease [Paenibacillus frigoriresistens]